MGLDSNDQRAPYAQVADALRRAVRDGTYSEGERLPSVAELASEFGVAKMTVQRAVSELREEGLLASWQGRGTYVREGAVTSQEITPAAPPDSLDELRREVQDLRRQYGRLEALLMDLYSRTGHAFPRTRQAGETSTKRAASA